MELNHDDMIRLKTILDQEEVIETYAPVNKDISEGSIMRLGAFEGLMCRHSHTIN